MHQRKLLLHIKHWPAIMCYVSPIRYQLQQGYEGGAGAGAHAAGRRGRLSFVTLPLVRYACHSTTLPRTAHTLFFCTFQPAITFFFLLFAMKPVSRFVSLSWFCYFIDNSDIFETTNNLKK